MKEEKKIEDKFIKELNKSVKYYNSISGFPELSLMDVTKLDSSYLDEIRNCVLTGKIQADELRQHCHDLERLIESYDKGEFE